jgi:hypothetical protein
MHTIAQCMVLVLFAGLLFFRVCLSDDHGAIVSMVHQQLCTRVTHTQIGKCVEPWYGINCLQTKVIKMMILVLMSDH